MKVASLKAEVSCGDSSAKACRLLPSGGASVPLFSGSQDFLANTTAAKSKLFSDKKNKQKRMCVVVWSIVFKLKLIFISVTNIFLVSVFRYPKLSIHSKSVSE